jgi:hypothetical protein
MQSLNFSLEFGVYNVGFEGPTAVVMRSSVFWAVVGVISQLGKCRNSQI